MKEDFFALVDQLPSAGEAQRRALEETIWAKFGVERAVLVLDMSHFSLSVRRSGILSYLGLIRRMQAVTAPMVEQCGGLIVEFLADNAMAVFPDVPNAVDCAVRVNRAFAAQVGPDGKPAIEVGIGIDFGRFLLVGGTNCYGDPVNTAFKLGEDLSRPGEILLTRVARERLGAACAYPCLEQQASVSGIEILAFSVQHQSPK